ncbi:hypothetical protein EIP91_007700 [Steccherinum ochraceum]|uniref:Uncharacterized protein n=1 Tax=Steccherinum ochraceum TaxID=92696 RepID=A0A4R0R3Z9_9APHY|nr:hypothetical protein EIP91_007700 [Steccherinum ochraceum]
MVDWSSDGVMTVCIFLFNQSVVLVLGVYLWEFILSFPEVDFALFTRRLKLRWMFVPYLLGRYGLLATLVTLTLYLHTTDAIDCPGTHRIPLTRRRPIPYNATTSLGKSVLHLHHDDGHLREYESHDSHISYLERKSLDLLVHDLVNAGALVCDLSAFAPNTSGFDPERKDSCHFEANAVLLFCLYTIAFDFVNLVLTLWGLNRSGVLRSSARSMWTNVYEQGVGYFVVTLLANLPTFILSVLRLNTPMTIIAVIPAATISVICSSRAVIALLSLREEHSRSSSQAFTSYRTRPLDDKGTLGHVDLATAHLTTDIHLHTMLDSTFLSEAAGSRYSMSPSRPTSLSLDFRCNLVSFDPHQASTSFK